LWLLLGLRELRVGSWLDHAKVISHDHCKIVYHDFGRHHMMSMFFCCCFHYGCIFYSDGNEDHRDSVLDFLPVYPFVHLSWFASKCVLLVGSLDGSSFFNILGTKMLV
jgi:hypothetical protein